MKINPASRPHAAFTLTELLMVVAVIGILVSLLLPALQTVRSSARSLVCTNRQHQLDIALTMYAEQSRGMLPPFTYGTSDMNMWYSLIVDDWSRLSMDNYDANSRLQFFCSEDSTTLKTVPWSTIHTKHYMSIGYNMLYLGSGRVRQATVPAPSKTIMLGDSWYPTENATGNTYGYAGLGPNDVQTGVLYPRHRKLTEAIVTFVDGHAQRIRATAARNYASLYRPTANGGAGANWSTNSGDSWWDLY